jgi:hypothetical protein
MSGALPLSRYSHDHPLWGVLSGMLTRPMAVFNKGHELDGCCLVQLGFIGWLSSVIFPISSSRLFEGWHPDPPSAVNHCLSLGSAVGANHTDQPVVRPRASCAFHTLGVHPPTPSQFSYIQRASLSFQTLRSLV